MCLTFDPCRQMKLKEEAKELNIFGKVFFCQHCENNCSNLLIYFSSPEPKVVNCFLGLLWSSTSLRPLYLGCKFIQCHNLSFWTEILKNKNRKIASQCNSFKLLLNCLPELPLLLLVIQEMRRDTYISSETAALYFPLVSPSSNLRFWISPSSRRGSVFSFTFRELEFQGT